MWALLSYNTIPIKLDNKPKEEDIIDFNINNILVANKAYIEEIDT